MRTSIPTRGAACACQFVRGQHEGGWGCSSPARADTFCREDPPLRALHVGLPLDYPELVPLASIPVALLLGEQRGTVLKERALQLRSRDGPVLAARVEDRPELAKLRLARLGVRLQRQPLAQQLLGVACAGSVGLGGGESWCGAARCCDGGLRRRLRCVGGVCTHRPGLATSPRSRRAPLSASGCS